MNTTIDEKQLVTFRVGSLFFGLDVGEVQEVLRSQPLTPVPLAPASVRGLVNLRGNIITAIDLKTLLKLPGEPSGATPMCVVVQAEEETASLLVDSIGDVIEVDSVRREDVPETIDSHVRGYLKGVVQLDDELLLILDNMACLAGDELSRSMQTGK